MAARKRKASRTRTTRVLPKRRAGLRLNTAEQAIYPAIERLCDEMGRLLRLTGNELKRQRAQPTTAQPTTTPVLLLGQCVGAARLLEDLSSYSVLPFGNWSQQEQSKAVLSAPPKLSRMGSSQEQIVETLTMMRLVRKPRGHPQVLRQLAAEALGMKLANPSLSWNKIATQLRPHDYPQGAHPFKERLCRDVERLRELLRYIEVFCTQSRTIR